MIYNDKSIGYSISWDSQNNIYVNCSKVVNSKQGGAIKEKVADLATHIRSDIMKTGVEVRKLNVIVNPSGELHVVAKLNNKNVEYDLTISKNSEKEAKQITDLLKKINFSKLKNTEKTPKDHRIDSTSRQFESNKLEENNSRNFLKKITTFFKRFYAFHVHVQPQATKIIQSSIEHRSLEDIKKIYASPNALYESIKDEVIARSPEISSLYEEDELNLIIDKLLIKEINDKLVKEKLPVLMNSDIYQLDILRVINHAKDIGLSTKDSNFLFKANPMILPLEEIAGIAITPANKDVLAELWTSIIGNIFAKGALHDLSQESNLKGIILQEQYVNRYLTALNTIPPEIKRDIAPFLADLNAKVSVNSLNTFIMQRSALTGTLVDSTYPELKAHQEIYLNRIKEPIDLFILERSGRANDATPLLKILGLEKGGYRAIEQLVESISNSLNKEERVHFNKEVLTELIFNELERVAVWNYDFTSMQLQNLREHRNDFIIGQKHSNILQELVEEYRTKHREITRSFKAKQIELQNQLDSPLVKLPALELPVEMASEQDKQNAIDSYIKNLKSSTIEAVKEHKKLSQEIVNINKKLHRLKGPKAKATEQEVKIKKNELTKLEEKMEQMKVLNEAQSSGKREKLQAILSQFTSIPIGPQTVNVNNLSPMYLDALKEVQKNLELKISTLNEELSIEKQQNVKRKKKQELLVIKEQIDGIKVLFEKIDNLKKQQEMIQKLSDDNKSAFVNLKKSFLKQYSNLLQEAVSIDALVKLGSDRSDDKLETMMWEKALKHLLNASEAEGIAIGVPLTEINKTKMNKYIEAKFRLLKMKKNDEAKQSLENTFKKLESQIQNEDMKVYLTEAVKAYKLKGLDDMLFNDAILADVENTEPSPVLSGSQQATLMRLTKILNAAKAGSGKKKQEGDNASVLTLEQKNELNEILGLAKSDKEFKDALNRFNLDSDDQEDFEQLLSHMPAFLHGIIRKFTDPVQSKVDKVPAGISEASIEFLRVYLSKSRNIGNIAKVSVLQEKIENLLNKYNTNPNSVRPEDRMSLAEMGILSRSARLNELDDEGWSFLKQIEELGLIEVNPKLQELYDNTIRSQKLLADLDKIIRPVINSHYKDGDLLAYINEKKVAWLGSPVTLEERLTSFAADGFTHGAKLYRKGEEVQISHIYGNHEQSPLSLYQICISGIWEIDVAPLVSQSMKVVLEKIYGENWPTKLNELNRKVENDLHARANEQFKLMGNNQERRVAAGLADHPHLFSMLGKDVVGHEREGDRDFQKIHAKFFGNQHPEKDQICSEWASKASLAAILETNKRLVKLVKEKYGNQYSGDNLLVALSNQGIVLSEDVKEYLQGVRHFKSARDKTLNAENELVKILKNVKVGNGRTYSDHDIELIIRLGNEEIIDLPYSKTERMKAIHPGRMVSLLVDKKCAIYKPPPKALSDLVAV